MGIPSVDEFLDFMPDTVVITQCTGRSVSGMPSYVGGTVVSYAAYIEMKNRLVIDRHGREVTAKGRVFLGTTTAPGLDDQVTLPVGITPHNPPIIAVNLVSDESGTHHVTLDIG